MNLPFPSTVNSLSGWHIARYLTDLFIHNGSEVGKRAGIFVLCL